MEGEAKVSILIVDDQPNNLFALEAVLEGPDRNLIRAASGEEALKRILDQDFAAILMDVQMPGMDGFETAALIRQRDRSKHTPILFLTGFETDDVQMFKSYSLGAVDYLSKPVIPAVLRSKVNVFVDLYLKAEQIRRQSALLVANQKQEHERELVEEKRRWEIERLREETAHEKKVAEALLKRTKELAETVAERTRAEEKLRHRAQRQAIVARLGQRALEGAELPDLLEEAVAAVVQDFDIECARVTELAPDGESIRVLAGAGWKESVFEVGSIKVGRGSFTGFGLLSSDALMVEDLTRETRFQVSPFLLRNKIVSGISVNIQGRAHPFGTLEAFSTRKQIFSSDDANFLQSLAHVLATAIQRRRDEEELSRIKDELAVQLADLTRLHALNTCLTNTLELQTILDQVVASVTSLQGTTRGVILHYDGELEAISTFTSIGFGRHLDVASGRHDAQWQGLDEDLKRTIQCGSLDELASIRVIQPFLQAAREEECISACVTPLQTVGGERVGLIVTFFEQPHQPSERETRLVELYAREAAEFIENARLYRRIREADRRKDEFLAMLAHELRNPLASILNALHLMGTALIDPDTIGQSREIAERQARHLAHLVDDLLDVSRISSGKIQLRQAPMNLKESIDRAVETSRLLIEQSGHSLVVTHTPEPVYLRADAARIEQVISNLLNNAAKYTEAKGWITLTAVAEQEHVEIQVRDTGIGISPELLPRVFDLFTQELRSLDRSQGGLGIGLTLVRSLVEMHGGTVKVYSEGHGRGSEFVVTLPRLVEVPQEAPAPVDSLERDTRFGSEENPFSKRILVVDDNVDGAVMLARILEGWGHEVLVAFDGHEAIETARKELAEVVLLDIGLPGISGYQIAEVLRSLPEYERVLLVALTGYGQNEDRRKSADAGFDFHLVKPVDPFELKRLLDRYHPDRDEVDSNCAQPRIQSWPS